MCGINITKYHSSNVYLTAGKVSKYGVFSGPHFHIFGLNTGKYGPEKKTYLDSFHTVPVNPKAHQIGRNTKSFHKNSEKCS